MKFSANHRVVFEETPLAEKNIYSTNFLIKRKRKTQLQINRNFVFFLKKKGINRKNVSRNGEHACSFSPETPLLFTPKNQKQNQVKKESFTTHCLWARVRSNLGET